MRQRKVQQGIPQIAALARSLTMLEAVMANRDGLSINAIATDLGLPRATAHRQVATLVTEKYLSRYSDGRLGAGPRLLALLRMVDENQPIIAAAAPLLHRLADKLRCIVQLGTLDNDMVTYRIKTGNEAGDLFTKVGMQLEAYCTAIGKVLLAYLPEIEKVALLSTGPFPALTSKTITDPARLREELILVQGRGYARDDEEIAEGLICLAVPIRTADGNVVAAISASRPAAVALRDGDDNVLAELLRAAQDIQSAAEPAGTAQSDSGVLIRDKRYTSKSTST